MPKNKLNKIVNFFDNLVKEERLDPRTRSTIAQAVKDLSHGLAIKDLKKVKKAVEMLSRSLLR